MTASIDHTVLPPGPTDTDALGDLASALASGAEFVLVAADGQRYELSQELRNVLVYASHALSEGRAVSLEPRHSVLSTQEAAGFLGISRPTLVKLLETGEIAFMKPGRHRRVKLEDLLAYQQRVRRNRRAVLDEMAAEGAEDDAYRNVNGFTETR